MESWLNRFLRTRPLAAVSMVVVIGACAGVSAAGMWPAFCICAGLFAAAAVTICVLRKPYRFAAWLCVVLFLAAGYGAYRAQRPDMQTQRSAVITGTVSDAPEWQNDKSRAVLHLTDVTVDGEKVDFRVRVYAYGELARRITPADQLSMQTNLYEPSRSGNGDFNFRNYLWAEGVGQYASLEAHEITVTPQDGGFMERMAEIRRDLQQRVDRLFPENAALLKGLMLGDRTDIAEEDEIAFSESGIMHLLAVSGLHVSILASLLTMVGVALCVPKALMMALVTLLLSAYAVLCGGSPSIVRSVLMYLLMQGGMVARRGSDDLTRLSAVCAAMVLINPLYLWQTGFQLSFAAVAGLMMLAPTMQQLRDRLPAPLKTGAVKWIGDLLIPGTAVQLGSLPIVISAFGQVSWMSLLLNILCIPLGQLALILGLITLGLDMVIPVGALAFVTDAITGWLLAAAHWAAELPFGLLHIPALMLPFAIAYAVCVLAASAQFRTKTYIRIIALCMLPALVAGSAALERHQVANEDFSITFFDVGQGDAALINADGSLYLMDVGEGDAVAQYISDHQLQIDGIFLSHAHDDHAGGLTDVLDVCDPEWICLPQGYYGGEADILALTEIAEAEMDGFQIRLLSAGDVVPLSDEIRAEVLYPAADTPTEGGNESSMLLRVTYGDGSALFTGDLLANCEPDDIPPCSVLKVAHHGSDTSTSSLFLARVRPTVAVISVGEGNPYGHPTPEVLQRLEKFGCTVLRTDAHGAVTVDIDKHGNVWATTRYPIDETE